MQAEKYQATSEMQIRQLIDDFVKAVREKDINGVMSNYGPKVVVFDIAPPLKYVGADAHKKNWEEWFATWKGSIGFEMLDLNVTADENVGYGYSLNRISGTRTNGEEIDVWVRWTGCFRKINDKWVIMHEQISVPFYMDGSNRAAVDLKP